MSEDTKEKKRNITPLIIDLTLSQLEDIVSIGVEEAMGFKLCRLYNEFDIDEGEPSVKIRVCGGPMNIPCECEISQKKIESIQDDFDKPVSTDETFREDEF